ncbi:MAG: ATP-binding protein, partial [Acidimicrobiales bacterium]
AAAGAAAAAASRDAQAAHRAGEVAGAARSAADGAVGAARAGLTPADAGLAGSELAARLRELRQAVAAKEEAAGVAARLRGRLERRPIAEASLADAQARLTGAERVVEALRDEVRALGFDGQALSASAQALMQATAAAKSADEAARTAELAAATARSHAEGEAKRLADGRDQHDRLAALDDEARHLSRVAVLLSEFRNTVVASVGPTLATQAAELFGELTDREYDSLTVDPETYELQISDHGTTYGLDRFSGSEVDLANLALRVAISEHIRFQSGGTVGLLVLDEVFGPLDEDRKGRMLQALESLRGRFRQVLVVTHDASIKEQLPSAIEVVKRPGRRATARLLA